MELSASAPRCQTAGGNSRYFLRTTVVDRRRRRSRPASATVSNIGVIELWLEAGVRRCLSLFQSGRDFLQDLADCHHTEILRTTYFESLKSKRRLALLREILAQVQAHMRRALPDPFRDFKHLADFDLYAGDGHFIAAASHDKAAPRKSPSKNKSSAKPPPSPPPNSPPASA